MSTCFAVCQWPYTNCSLEGFDVAKTGDARIGFVGFPSVGKSTLLSNLAGVYSEVAAYEFTTLTTVPGVIRYKGAKIQVRTLVFEGAVRCSRTTAEVLRWILWVPLGQPSIFKGFSCLGTEALLAQIRVRPSIRVSNLVTEMAVSYYYYCFKERSFSIVKFCLFWGVFCLKTKCDTK